MTNTRLRDIKGYDEFKAECDFFRCEEEYPNWTGTEKYIVVSDLSESELFSKYPAVIEAMRPLIVVSREIGAVRRDSYNAERRAKRFSSKCDAFGFNEETELYHSELVDFLSCERAVLSMEMQEALKTLSDIQRSRVIRYYFEGLTMEEIANSDGTVKSAVKKSLDLSLTKLHKYFSGEGELLPS